MHKVKYHDKLKELEEVLDSLQEVAEDYNVTQLHKDARARLFMLRVEVGKQLNEVCSNCGAEWLIEQRCVKVRKDSQNLGPKWPLEYNHLIYNYVCSRCGKEYIR